MTELFGTDLEMHYSKDSKGIDHLLALQYNSVYKKMIIYKFGYSADIYDLKWERHAPRKEEYTKSYDLNLPRIKKSGNDRPPRADEIMSLIYAYFEDNLPPKLQSVAEDVVNLGNEYVSCGIQFLDDKIMLYDGFMPSYLKASKNDKMRSDMFSLSDDGFCYLPTGERCVEYYDDSELMEFLFLRKLDSIPGIFSKTDGLVGLQIPDDNELHMLGFSFTNDFFGFKVYDESVARGVRR